MADDQSLRVVVDASKVREAVALGQDALRRGAETLRADVARANTLVAEAVEVLFRPAPNGELFETQFQMRAEMLNLQSRLAKMLAGLDA